MLKQVVAAVILCNISMFCGDAEVQAKKRGVVEQQSYPGAPEDAAAARRNLSFNGVSLSDEQQYVLAQVEARIGFRFPDGAYWYDPKTGAAGAWGGPMGGVMPAGLNLGGPMPPNCSGGGTGIFVNGRELHPMDVAAIQRMFGYAIPGRYFMDAQGNLGVEGGPVLANLYQLAQRALSGAGGGQGQSSAPRGGILSTYDKTGAYVIPH